MPFIIFICVSPTKITRQRALSSVYTADGEQKFNAEPERDEAEQEDVQPFPPKEPAAEEDEKRQCRHGGKHEVQAEGFGKVRAQRRRAGARQPAARARYACQAQERAFPTEKIPRNYERAQKQQCKDTRQKFGKTPPCKAKVPV